MQLKPIRIGTRGSPLALAQAHEVRDRLMAAHARPTSDFEIVTIRTSGDRIQDRSLAEAGGKGLFTKEIEEALADGQIDLAVHSMKDVPTLLPDGLEIAAVLPREDVRDAFICLTAAALADLPAGAVVGTSSLRREAQIRHIRPDLRVTGFRGNVETRLRKLSEGVADATLLACAGLRRLGMADRITAAIPVETMLPAVAQGAVGIEVCSRDTQTQRLVAAIDDAGSRLEITAERAFLARLEGSCRTPIAGLARLEGNRLTFRGQVLSPDGRRSETAGGNGRPENALDVALEVAETLLRTGADIPRGTA